MRDDGLYAVLGIFGGLCMIMIMILRNTPPTGVQWLAIMFVSGGGGFLAHLMIESHGQFIKWETSAAFVAGFCATQFGKYALECIENPKKLLAIFNWIRGKNELK